MNSHSRLGFHVGRVVALVKPSTPRAGTLNPYAQSPNTKPATPQTLQAIYPQPPIIKNPKVTDPRSGQRQPTVGAPPLETLV